VISSTRGDEKVFKALELGAVDFITKPTSIISEELLQIQQDLHEKVQAVFKLNMARLRKGLEPAPAELPHPSLRGAAAGGIEVVAIGSSTGGPPALQRIFAAFKEPLPFAMVIAQHMPAGFTTTFAERLNRSTGFEVKEARDGDLVLPGRVLLAPGGRNLVLLRTGEEVVARVMVPQEKDRYVPSVDALFSSCARIYKSRMLVVVLTGMGNDGAQGVCEAKGLGAQVIAESEESAVIFGMPREAIATGFVDWVVPLDAMVREIVYRSGVTRFGI
jgi:two-component system chemotaxis response regulator CheB